MILKTKRSAVARLGKRMLAAGLTTGTGGNLSWCDRRRGLVAVSPSGVAYDRLTAGDVTVVDQDGRRVEGTLAPSSELPFHLALYRHRPDVAAVVHTHSVYATTLACLHWEIPAVHYLVGFAGPKVPLAPYATYGTEALARGVVDAIGSANAVLLANHGMIAVGADLEKAFAVAEEIELVARIYYQAKAVGTPRILPDDEMQRVMKRFKSYGKPPED
ncbi:MAG: L-fuculose-phosphate aldolase [Desulfobacteraceae bacterium]|jgi:L-fuculose-phosphate aldolase|nr:L-fuculose-phosphate aldolase [Desulfobacteraceae bacterium]